MRILIVALLTILGFSAAFIGAMGLTGGNVPWSLLLGSIGGAMGMVCTDLLYVFIAPRPNRRQTAPAASPRVCPPRGFDARLAEFTKDVKPSPRDVVERSEGSRMPFWSAVDSLVRVPPKSAALIRRTLLRIRVLLGRTVSQ